MSLRLRLVLLILVLVALVAVTLSALELQTLVEAYTDQARQDAELAGQQVSAFLIDQINLHAADYEPPESIAQTRAMWTDIAATDPDISPELERTTVPIPSLLEINIAGRNGRILASSSPPNISERLARRTPFSEWNQIPWYRRTWSLVDRSAPDLEVTVPLGIAGESDTIFTVQVVSSSVLVRDALMPEFNRLFSVSGAAVVISLLLVLIATHRVLRPLERIERTIDRITQGRFESEESKRQGSSPGAKEFRAVQDKLNLLGQRLSDAQGDGRGLTAQTRAQGLDVMVETMASQLAVANRLAAISRLSGGVAHEIKNPLNAILLRLDLLRARLEAGQEPEELAGEIDVLSKEVVRLDRVVKTFLDFSRPVEVKLQELDLKALIQEIVDFIRPQAEAAGIAVVVRLPEDDAFIQGDADLLKQALLNLVTNAVEAMQERTNGDQAEASEAGNQLEVALSHDPAGEGRFALEISDTGPGIPPAKREKVFQLYFTTKEKGSGIGLAMTYRAVQLHNGTITFRTASGQGTTFRIELPATVRQAAPYVAS